MSEKSTSFEPYTPGRPGPEAPWRPSDAVVRPGDAEVLPSTDPLPRSSGAPDCLVVASIVCVAIWAMSGFGYFWPIWVLLPTVLPVVLGARRSWGRKRRPAGPWKN